MIGGDYLSITFRSVNEFHVFMDMLISTINEGNSLKVELGYKGIIYSGNISEFNTADVQKDFGSATINASYVDGEFIVKSVASKKVVKWIMDNTAGSFRRVNNYLPFLSDNVSIEIYSVLISGQDITDKLSINGLVNLSALSKYIVSETEYKSIKYNLTNGRHIMTLIYFDNCFVRLVKLDGRDTLYINNPETLNDKFKGFYVEEFFFGPSLPDLNTQINLFRGLAEKSESRFTHIIS